MSTKQDPLIHAYVRLIRCAESVHAHVSRGLVAEGLTPSQFSTLKVLSIKGPLAQRDIAKYLLKTGGNVTLVIDNLEKRGFVTRTRDTQDRRLVYVQLTAAGSEAFERLYPGHLDRIRDAMSGLTDQECASLVELLQKVSYEEAEAACLKEDSDILEPTG